LGRLRGFLWLLAGLAVAALAGIVGFITLSRAAAQTNGEARAKPGVAVVVAAHAIGLRSALTAEDLVVKEIPIDLLPEGAIADVEDAQGKVSLVELSPGEVILAHRLMDPNVISGDGRLALSVAEDQVLMAFPATDLMSKVGILKPGDHVDLLISLHFPANRGMEIVAGESEAAGPRQEEELATFVVLENVGIAAFIGGPSSDQESGGLVPSGAKKTSTVQALLFTLSPQDALVLKYVKDAGAVQDIVLRAPGSERPFSTEPVDVDFVINRFRIPTEAGR